MSRHAVDLTGRGYGRLFVLGRGTGPGRGVYWLCVCACGQRRNIRADYLTNGAIVSCGCARREMGHIKAATMRRALSIAGSRQKRVADAFADVFGTRADTVHVDRPGARVIRGGRY